MSGSMANSPSRGYQHPYYDIKENSGYQTDGRKPRKLNSVTTPFYESDAAPQFDQYAGNGRRSQFDKELTQQDREINQLKIAKMMLEKQKKQKDLQLAKIQQDKEFFMKSAIQTNHKLKDIKQTQLNSAIDENDQLKNQLKEFNDREKSLQILVKNQKSQISDLEKKLIQRGERMPVVNHAHTITVPSSTDHSPVNPNSQSLNNGYKFGENSSPFLSGRHNEDGGNQYAPNGYQQRENSLHNNSIPNAQDSFPKDQSKRNYTPLTRRKKPLPMTQDFINSLNTNGKPNISTMNRSRADISPMEIDPNEAIPDDLEKCTPDELMHAIQVMQKVNLNQDRRHKQELENLKFKLQRGQIDDVEHKNALSHKDAQIHDLENKLQDKEKELSMAYLKLQSNEPRRITAIQKPGDPSSSSVPYPPSPGMNGPYSYNPQNFNGNNSGAGPNGNPKSNTPQRPSTFHADEDENLRIASHGKLVRVTVWTNFERVVGFSLQYLKEDGSLVQPNNNYFYSRNLRYDYFVIDDEDSLAEMYGKFNIKGVRILTLKTQRGIEQSFRPIPTDQRTKEEQRPELDQMFKYQFRPNENILKAIFPNVFHFDMKGARIADRQDQNFLYVETNKIVSLQNPQMGTKSYPQPPPPQPQVVTPPPKAPTPQPKVATPQPVSAEDYAANRPMSHYYSDSYESYQLKESQENDKGKINFSDGELIFIENRLKIYQVRIWSDQYFVYGIQVSYLTPDGYTLINGKQHVGIENLLIPSHDITISDSESFLSQILVYRKNNVIEKIILVQTNGTRNSFGRPIPTSGSKEISIDLTLDSYVYGSLTMNPNSLTPGNLVLSTVKAGKIGQ